MVRRSSQAILSAVFVDARRASSTLGWPSVDKHCGPLEPENGATKGVWGHLLIVDAMVPVGSLSSSCFGVFANYCDRRKLIYISERWLFGVVPLSLSGAGPEILFTAAKLSVDGFTPVSSTCVELDGGFEGGASVHWA